MTICTRCIMTDKGDPTITFDGQGRCNYCTDALQKINTTAYFPNEEGARRLEAMLAKIKKDGEGKPYDCIMGISGGLDSAYLAYLGYTWGLRILAVHVDDGYDTDISKENIRKLVEAAHIEMITIRPDAEQYNDLLLAYMRAGVPNLAVPQDNILLKCLYDTVRKYKISYFLSGDNFALECILQRGNTYKALDAVNIRDIHKRFGTMPMDKLKLISTYEKYFSTRVAGLHQETPLNYIDYNRERAFRELREFCGFAYYGRKHLENKFTAFLQLYWLPRKFGVDKRSSHLSSMIVSGQMTREEALAEIAQPICDEAVMAEYITEIKQNMHLSDEEFEKIMAAPVHQHTDYKTDKLDPILRSVLH